MEKNLFRLCVYAYLFLFFYAVEESYFVCYDFHLLILLDSQELFLEYYYCLFQKTTYFCKQPIQCNIKDIKEMNGK